jgi:hypothetical protein
MRPSALSTVLAFALGLAATLPPGIANLGAYSTRTVYIQGPDDSWVDLLCCGQSSDVTVDSATPVAINLTDEDGGDLWDGDVVSLGTGPGFFGDRRFSVFFGSEIAVRSQTMGNFTDYERFRIWSDECSDCEVPDGHVYFQSVQTGKWWLAAGCGGGALLGDAETLTSYCSRFEVVFD